MEIKAYLHSNFTAGTSILDFLLNPREENDIGFFIEILGKSESVTKALQNESIDLTGVRLLFDGVIEKLPYTDTSKYLAENAAIIQHEEFETGVGHRARSYGRGIGSLSVPCQKRQCRYY